METTSPEPDDAFGLVEQFDSIEDPYLRSEFLDAVGTTRSYINALRLRRDQAARKTSAPIEPDQEAATGTKTGRVDGEGPQRRTPRPPVRTRVLATRPPRYAGSVRSKRRRNRRRPEIVVIIFKLD
ncbi:MULTISPECIES: hypothetical protein [unclassified Streptomyces]|uniref:hypothetical protein n=1 Tax=unclassified Streptomyces TaxID=2593676 RepID=UPI0029A1DAAB|nr:MULTISPECIES: hypothetical protein [unclassified Streptomyces]MDX3687246.1 hypothetical protein [Streptomyces sp. AK04-4c]